MGINNTYGIIGEQATQIIWQKNVVSQKYK